MQMVFNVKRFKRMMQNTLDRQAQQRKQYGEQAFMEGQKQGFKRVDFAKLVKKIDWSAVDVIKLRRRVLKDVDRIKDFHEQRARYYRQLQHKKNYMYTNN